VPYNAPPTFFVPGTWEAGSSNSHRERMEKKYEKNNGRNSDWYDDRGKDDNTDTTYTSTTTFLTSTSSSERSAWHPTDNSYTKNRNQININNEDDLLSENDNYVGENGSTEGERFDGNSNKNDITNNNEKIDNADNRKSNVQYATNQELTNEQAGTANTEILIDIKQILEMEKAKKLAKKFNKKSKVATYWEENPELTGTRYSNTVRQGGDGVGIGAGVGVDRVGEDGRLVSRSSAEQGGRSGLTARQSSTTSTSSSFPSSSVSSFSASATTSLSTSTLKRVESCESFYLSVYFYFPHLRAFLIQIKNDHENKNYIKKKRKKSGNKLEKEKTMKICDTDFKFHGNGHQILWKILEKMETKMIEEGERVEGGGGREEGEGGKSLTSVPMKSNGIFDANSFLKEVELFISNPNEYFQPKKISNKYENESKNKNENESININVNVNENNENGVSGGDRGDDNNVKNNDRDADIHREKEMEREKDSNSNSIRDRLDGREKNFDRDGNSNRERDSNREKERGRREYAYLSASALEMIQGKKVIGKSKLSIEFAIQDGQRIIMEYEARKEQIELLSKFRTESIQTQIPPRNTETIISESENTEIQDVSEKLIFLTEESFNSENIFFNTLEDRTLDANIDVSELKQQASVIVSSASREGNERGRVGDSRGVQVTTITNIKSNLIEKEVEKEVEKEEEIGLEEYLEQLLIVEQRTSSLCQERAERSSSLWEDYINRVRNNRIDGISDESTRGRNRGGGGGGVGDGGGGGAGEGEGVQGDGGEGGEGEDVGDVVDSITMQDTEMLFYLQSPDDTDTLDNHHNNNNNNDNDNQDDYEGEGEDGVLEMGYINSQYAFNFDGDAGAILEEGAYMDEREKDQVIESRARKSSGKYRSVLWSAVSCGGLCSAVFVRSYFSASIMFVFLTLFL
jgi:hypothetical protein